MYFFHPRSLPASEGEKVLVTQAFVVTDKFKKKSQRPQDSPRRNSEEYLQPRPNDRDRNTFSAPSISPRVPVTSERVTLREVLISELYLTVLY